MTLASSGLRGPPCGVPSLLGSYLPFHNPCVEIAVDERDDCFVLDCSLQYLYQLGMIDRVKEAFEVYLHRIAVALFNYLRRGYQCPLASTLGTEAVAPLAELTLIDRTEHLGYCLLKHAVYHRGYSQLAFAPAVLGYLYPADGIRTVGPLANTLFQFLSVLDEIAEQSAATHFVYSCRSSVALHLKIRRVQIGM